jgi:hypothetical protein
MNERDVAAMTDEQVNAAWLHTAMFLLEQVRAAVNLPAFIGTDEETGVAVLFFNTKNHRGKSTLVSTETSAHELRLLLRTAAAGVNQAHIVEPEKPQ